MEESHNNQIRRFQRQLLEMGFELTLINRLFTHYNITRLEQAIDYLVKIDDKWNHPFVNYGDNEIFICQICKDSIEYHNSEFIHDDNIIRRISMNSIPRKLSISLNESRDHKDKFNENSKDLKSCEICFSFIGNEVSVLPCKELICNGCVKDYLISKINNAEVSSILCPNHRCKENYIFDEDLIKLNLSEEIFKKYKKFLRRNEIARNKNLIICPIEDCESYAYLQGIEENNIDNIYDMEKPNLDVKLVKDNNKQFLSCQNKHTFCTKCNQFAHPGINCERKLEKEFFNYVNLENVKKCPECGFYIKKDAGCNHMTCGNMNCKYEFCWICLKEYTPTHYSNPLSSCYGFNYINDNSLIVRFKFLRYFRILGIFLIWIIIIAIMLSIPSIILFIVYASTSYTNLMNYLNPISIRVRRFVLFIYYACGICLSVSLLSFGYILVMISPGLFCIYAVINFTLLRLLNIRRNRNQDNLII